MLAEIKELLALQGIDGRLADLAAHRKRLILQGKSIEERIESEREAVEALRRNLAELERMSRLKNLEVDELDESIREYRTRLETGIISFKEMEDLRLKIESERSRMSEMEDEALSLMEAIERGREELVEAEERLKQREEEFRSEGARIASSIEETEGRIAELEAERERLTARITPYLLSQYEALHAKYPDPLAVISHGTCAGCKLKVSGNTVERAKGGMGIVRCEHCSRILYVD